ncbi:MAG: sensor histidine kinase [Prolixibacteraceae bacterium]
MKLDKINFNATTTNFASAKRADLSVVLNQFKSINDVELIDQVFAKIPLMFQILNKDRQIIYMNELLKIDLKDKGIDSFLGYRSGEVLQCVNSQINEGGCGTSFNCSFCGIIKSVLKANESNSMVSSEAIFESNTNGKNELTVYNVTAKPFYWKDQTFTTVTFENINDKKKKEQLERTFFHDLMNKVSSISGLSEILLMDEKMQDNEFIQMIKRSIYDLADEVRFQRNIVSAENDELVIHHAKISSLELIQEMKEDFLPYEKISEKLVNIAPGLEDLTFNSDIVLVKRTLTNLIKNALEAIKSGDEINIGYNKKEHSIEFWIQNKIVLSDEIKSKIFKRSFSTKGAGRGIGTYSVKLFTEKYLKGKASFTSDSENGTIFFAEFPLNE